MIYIGIILLIIGIACLGIEIFKRKTCTVITQAKVVDIKERVSYKNEEVGPRNIGITVRKKEISYYPVYEYEVNENRYIKQSLIGKSICPFQIGQNIKIKYNPKNPDDYYVKEMNNIMPVGIWSTIIGIVMTILC